MALGDEDAEGEGCKKNPGPGKTEKKSRGWKPADCHMGRKEQKKAGGSDAKKQCRKGGVKYRIQNCKKNHAEACPCDAQKKAGSQRQFFSQCKKKKEGKEHTAEEGNGQGLGPLEAQEGKNGRNG